MFEEIALRGLKWHRWPNDRFDCSVTCGLAKILGSDTNIVGAWWLKLGFPVLLVQCVLNDVLRLANLLALLAIPAAATACCSVLVHRTLRTRAAHRAWRLVNEFILLGERQERTAGASRKLTWLAPMRRWGRFWLNIIVIQCISLNVRGRTTIKILCFDRFERKSPAIVMTYAGAVEKKLARRIIAWLFWWRYYIRLSVGQFGYYFRCWMGEVMNTDYSNFIVMIGIAWAGAVKVDRSAIWRPNMPIKFVGILSILTNELCGFAADKKSTFHLPITYWFDESPLLLIRSMSPLVKIPTTKGGVQSERQWNIIHTHEVLCYSKDSYRTQSPCIYSAQTYHIYARFGSNRQLHSRRFHNIYWLVQLPWDCRRLKTLQGGQQVINFRTDHESMTKTPYLQWGHNHQGSHRLLRTWKYRLLQTSSRNLGTLRKPHNNNLAWTDLVKYG